MKKESAKKDARKVRAFVRNILKIHEQATAEEIANGLQWYAEAFRLIVTVKELLLAGSLKDITPMIACAVTAALSPNNSWKGNILDLQRLLVAWRDGSLEAAALAYDAAEGSYLPRGNRYAFKSLGLTTYPANILKAYRILAANSLEPLTGQKIQAFFHNIFHAESGAVTVDAHAFSVASGKHFTTKTCPKITPKVYAEISEAYTVAAEAIGIRPYQLQAITWCTWRRIIGIHSNKG